MTDDQHTAAFVRYFEGYHVSSGPCPGCADCGLEDLRCIDDDPQRYDAAHGASVDHSPYRCPACGELPGTRYPVHLTPYDSGDTGGHVDVCETCYVFAEYGDEAYQR